MLKKFTVTNFKNFRTKISFDLGSHSNYEFNDEILKDGCVTKGIVYGINGSGKSNLALALFDIVLHLTDKERVLDRYYPYLNLNSNKPYAEFEYCFEFSGSEVIYRYGKTDPLSLVYETLTIDGEEAISYDFAQKNGYAILKGAENLQLSSSVPGMDKLSRVKYIKNNAMLADNMENRTFMAFSSFVERMLMFYSLQQNRYQGFLTGTGSFTQGIINDNKLQDFEDFLRKHSIDYNLIVKNMNGQPEIFCKFPKDEVPFSAVASSGTKSLALFYFWYLKMSEASFVYVDEYDAFYHFELSQALVELVKNLPDTQIIFSTHNTDLMSNDLLRPDAYFLIENNKMKSLDKISDKELRRAHNLQKMYKAGAFNV